MATTAGEVDENSADAALGYVCEECRESVANEQVSTCPHCGHDPGADIRSEAKRGYLLAVILCLTVVGGILGLPLAAYSYHHEKKADAATPAMPA